jgi:protein deglycase
LWTRDSEKGAEVFMKETAIKRILVPFAPGTEDMEMIILTDVLTRAGAEVIRASFAEGPVTLGYGTRLMPDALLKDVRDINFDMIAIPGGWKGAEQLDIDPDLAYILEKCKTDSTPVGAVCSAPNVLRRHGFMKDGVSFTAHPATVGFAQGGKDESNLAVVRSPGLITGRSAGHTMDWALEIVEFLFGIEKRGEVYESLGFVSMDKTQ